MKKSVKITTSVICILLVAVLSLGGAFMFYYPHYKSFKMEVVTSVKFVL